MNRLMLVALLVFAASAHAQIDRKMNDIFASMSNVTRPGVVEGQTRGVVSGGSVQARFGNAGIQVVGFTPPSFSAGCGGIDAYGGSFSFINKEEFTNFARKVAANAAGYMFNLALTNVCPTCQTVMTQMQSKVEALNGAFRNSCETAQLLVDKSGAGAAARSMGDSIRSYMTRLGSADDYNDAAQVGPGKDSEGATVAQRDANAARKLIPGNILMQALKGVGANTWFGNSGDEVFYQDVMSVVGTVIVCVPGVDGCRSPEFDTSGRNKEPTAFTVHGLVTFRDLIYGTDSGQGGAVVQFLRCSGECLDPTPTAAPGFKGMATRIIELMAGTDPDGTGPNVGLIGKLARNVGQFTPQEQGFMTGAGFYTSKALSLARTNERDAREYVEFFAPELAAEMLTDFLDRLIRWTTLAVDRVGHDATGQMREMLDAARADMREQRMQIESAMGGRVQLMAYYDLLMRNQEPANLPPAVFTTPGTQ